ncbi:MAG: C4-type zinc ribbon domain-containing protein [Rikenellaceae bacterium]|nr:C4-type zinc ribbon domain-containing protein [Rikenellaceae bacterium]
MATKKQETKEISTKDKLIALYRLQQIESQEDEINRLKGELPFEVQDLEDDVEGMETRLRNMVAEVDDLSRKAKSQKDDIEAAKLKIAKYEEQQSNVRNNREFESLAKEIEYQKLEIELCEKRIKEYSAAAKNKKKSIEECKASLADRKIDLDNKRAELESIDQETAKEIADLRSQAETVAADIDERLLTAYRKIRGGMRNGLAVVEVKRDACGGCFNRIPPQRQLDIRMSKKIIVCEYCGRILISDKIEEVEE